MNEECPLGITNKKEIERIKDVTTIMIENIEKSIAELGSNMEKKFEELNKKIDSVDKQIKEINGNLPDQISNIVDNKMKVGVFSVVKWLAISIGGVAVATVIGKIITEMISK